MIHHWSDNLEHSIILLVKFKNTSIEILGIDVHLGFNYHLCIYGITGDCPALKLILKHVNHQGYWCCWICFVKGTHVGNKRQYYFEEDVALRASLDYQTHSIQAATEKRNVFGHLGISPLFGIIDTPLPYGIVIDYMHVSLLRHTKTVLYYVYNKILKPKQRNELDELLRCQSFPHFFNRKMRAIKDFAFCKYVRERSITITQMEWF